MPTIWFSYSTVAGIDADEPCNSPYTVTWNVGRFLRDKASSLGYGFEYRNLDSDAVDKIGTKDIIIGHTWFPDGAMNRALDSKARAKFVLQPYQPDMVGAGERDWIKALFAKADHLLFITGRHWWDAMPETPFASWRDMATRLDMAINPALHPHSKVHWNAPGKRRFLCIGADIPAKGLDNIAALFRQHRSHLGYYGPAPLERFEHVPQFYHHAGALFTPEYQVGITREYDAFVSLANSDANPTTLLESAAWGLLPLCNAESGYVADQPFMELRRDDLLFNLEQLDAVQSMEEYELRNRTEAIRAEVVANYNWDKFNATLWAQVEKYL